LRQPSRAQQPSTLRAIADFYHIFMHSQLQKYYALHY
jgi:hypothetical protein